MSETDVLTMTKRSKEMSDLIAQIQSEYEKRGDPKPNKTEVIHTALKKLALEVGGKKP